MCVTKIQVAVASFCRQKQDFHAGTNKAGCFLLSAADLNYISGQRV